MKAIRIKLLLVVGLLFMAIPSTKLLAAQTGNNSIKTVKGRVLDASGNPVVGVSVAIQGTTVGTISDGDGNYSLNVHPGDVLTFSSVGLTKQTIKVSDQNSVYDVKMASNDNMLNAVVVTALGIKREEKALSYNVGKIDTKQLNQVKDANFLNSLNGKVAGLTVNSSNNAGGATRVVLRGAKSISKDNNALYVIDGIPIINSSGGKNTGLQYAGQPTGGEGISDLDPEDIESISVLTGPAAAALYGSYAANGAILITTKKGSAGKPKVNVSYDCQFSKPLVMPKFQNTYGNVPGSFQSWGDRMASPTSFDPEDYFNTGYNSTVSASVSTGTKQNQTYVSAASTNSAGIIPNNTYNRYNFAARNTTSMLHDKFVLDLGAQFIIQNDKNMLSQGVNYNPLLPTYLFPRGENFNAIKNYETYDDTRSIMTQYWPYGPQSMNMQNPYWINNRNLFPDNRNRYMLNASLKYNATKWLNFVGRIRVDNSVNRRDRKLYASTDSNLADSQGYYETAKTDSKQTYADLMANIDKTFGDFTLNANIGASYFDTHDDVAGFQGQLSQMPNFFAGSNIDFNARDSGILQSATHEQTQSVFANVEVGWKSMLYLTLTGRNDWSSALANTPNSSFFYPSVGLSALISQMVKLPTWFSYLKVRGSYTSVASAPQPYLTVPTYPYEHDNHGSAPQTLSTGDIMTLKPENTKSYEAGIDMRFFNNKLSLSGTFYKSNTYDQTFDIKRSATSGYPDLIVQSGNIQNWGIEASIGFHDDFGQFHWDSNLNFNMNRNKIVALAQNYFDPLTNTTGSIDQLIVEETNSYQQKLVVGGEIGDIYTNSYLARDANGNLKVDANGNLIKEKGSKKVGNSSPRANLGFSNNFSYKGFHLGITFTARLGGQVASYTQALMDQFGVSKASADARDQGFVYINNGRDKINPYNYFNQSIGGSEAPLENYIYSATNVRLQELSFGYTFPKKLLGNIQTTVSFVGRNLWMIYNKAPFDPEGIATTGDSNQGIDYFMTPSTRNMGFSVKFKF